MATVAKLSRSQSESANALAFNAGSDARLAGIPSWLNPYKPEEETSEHLSWQRGWKDVAHSWGTKAKGPVPPLPPITNPPA